MNKEMKSNKALKNIPKPDPDKLAIFYGIPSQKDSSSQNNLNTVDKKSTVGKMSTVPDKSTVDISFIQQLDPKLSPSQRLVYLNLLSLSQNTSDYTTDWLGYKQLSKLCHLTTKTIQRSIRELTKQGLIHRVSFINTSKVKGSKYKVISLKNEPYTIREKELT